MATGKQLSERVHKLETENAQLKKENEHLQKLVEKLSRKEKKSHSRRTSKPMQGTVTIKE